MCFIGSDSMYQLTHVSPFGMAAVLITKMCQETTLLKVTEWKERGYKACDEVGGNVIEHTTN